MLPILYQNDELIIYSYPLLMGLGWGFGYQIFFAKTDLSWKFSQIIFWGLFVSSWIGAKLLFFLTTKEIHQTALTQASFWTGGGFVFYGGLILSIVFLSFYKSFKLPLTLNTLWSLLSALTLGHAIGRLGCLLAGCCFGAPTELWWGIHLHGANRHPTQILESLGLILISLMVVKSKPSLKSAAIYFMGYGILRFGIECLRGDEIRGLWGMFSPSQWISFGLILFGLTLTVFNQNKPIEELVQK